MYMWVASEEAPIYQMYINTVVRRREFLTKEMINDGEKK